MHWYLAGLRRKANRERIGTLNFSRGTFIVFAKLNVNPHNKGSRLGFGKALFFKQNLEHRPIVGFF